MLEQSLEKIKEKFDNCDWFRAILNDYTINLILRMIDRIEELEKQCKDKDV